jgi:hypothetical protein
MSFKLSVSKDFPAVVNAEIPGDNGRPQKISFKVRFARLSTTEVEDLIKRIQSVDDDGQRTLTDQEVVNQVLTDFGDDLLDDNGNQLSFTDANIAALCDVHPIRPAIVASFFDAYFKAKAKN